MAITATFSHMLLWHYNDIKSAWAFASVANFRHLISPRDWNWKFWKTSTSKWGGEEDTEDDPHYRLMTAYKDVPNWWYGMVLILSITIGLLMLYLTESTLPWWGFLVACSLSSICILFFGAQTAITGFGFNVQPVIQMLGGYLHPGRPMANMYFVLFGYNSVAQGHLLLKDLKFAQYSHLSPRCTFTMQMVCLSLLIVQITGPTDLLLVWNNYRQHLFLHHDVNNHYLSTQNSPFNRRHKYLVRPNYPNLQFTSHSLGRPCLQTLQCRRKISVGDSCIPDWLCHPSTILLRSQEVEQGWLRLLEFCNHHILHWRLVRWDQLFPTHVFLYWILYPILLEEV